jgi:hypothetical protein
MKHILTIYLCMAPAFMLRAEIPELFLKEKFNANVLAVAVNHYIEVGPKQAATELTTIASFYEANGTNDVNLKSILATRGENVYLAERLGWVCRVLFEAKPKEALRPPGYGRLMLPFLTMPEKNWPLFPVAHSGRSYFVLSEGYSLSGVAESPRHYLEYCRKNGVFRTMRVAMPTREEAKADAIALWNSPAWKVIKWTDKTPNIEYTFPEMNTRLFIEKQYDSIGIEASTSQ